MVWRTLAVSVVSLLSVIIGYNGEVAHGLSTCSYAEVIGVRGSGQLYGESEELRAINSTLSNTVEFKELENKIDFLHTEPKYEAIKVANDNKPTKDGFIAWISSSRSGEYRKSVDSGKNLLKKYIEHFQPTDTCLVLVGYSQGAQVVGETVRDMHKADPASLKNVIYIGLLGDPQYSPYGFDTTRKPTWFRGDALYPFTGMLGAREPDYVPRNPNNQQFPFTKIGSWCNYGDVICATDVTHFGAMRDGHATYVGDSIRDMVDEIRAAIATPDQNITGALYPSSVCGAEKQDLVVLLDTSAYMRRNRDLFTKEKNTWDTKRDPTTQVKLYRTFGEQLLDSGCPDKRVAVVGFEGESGPAPRLLLDFTDQAKDIDTLMDSLYQASNGGVAERVQIREAAILAMQQPWRTDASRTLLAITGMAGSGPAGGAPRETWLSSRMIERQMSDTVGQKLLNLSRQTRAAIIAPPWLPLDTSGYVMPSGFPSPEDEQSYLQALTNLTGGYNWEKVFVLYPSRPSLRNVSFAESIRQFEIRRDATKVTMRSVRAKVGEPVTLSVNDSSNLLASAVIRGHGTATDWYLECDAPYRYVNDPSLQRQPNGTVIYIPKKAGTCLAAVRVAVQGSGNGCYWGCPEPFPPYMMKMIPFMIDIRPADYKEQVPGEITKMSKTIYDDHIDLSWVAPAYDGTDLTYFVKDPDGAVLAATTATRATITETDKQDVEVKVQAIGVDGRSSDFSSLDERVTVLDERTLPATAEIVKSPSLMTIASIVTGSVPPVETASTESTPSTEAEVLGQSNERTAVTTRSSPYSTVAKASYAESGVRNHWWWSVPLAILAAIAGVKIRRSIRSASHR